MTHTTMEERFREMFVFEGTYINAKEKLWGEIVGRQPAAPFLAFITTEIERAKREKEQEIVDFIAKKRTYYLGERASALDEILAALQAPDLSDCHYCNRFPFREHDCRNKRATLSDKE